MRLVSRLHALLAVCLLVSALAVLAVAPAVASASATISGTVTDTNTGEPLFWVYVSIFAKVDGVWSDTYLTQVNSDGAGAYSFSVPAGSYQVSYYSTGRYQSQWWGGGTDRMTAAAIDVADGDAFTADAHLALKPVTYIGFTKDMDDLAVPGITVEVLRASDDAVIGATTSDAQGNYSLSADGLFTLPPYQATTKLRFSDTLGSYATQTTDSLMVIPGSDENINSWLVASQTGEVTGRILSATGATVPGVEVSVVTSSGGAVGSAVSDASGSYDIPGLPVAYHTHYDVRFNDPSGTYRYQELQGIACPPGTPVQLDATLLLVHPVLPGPDGHWLWQNPRPQGNDLQAIDGPDADHLWAVGKAGTILASSDGGAHWLAQLAGSESDLYGVCFPDLLHGWAVGAGGIILSTADGGTTWTVQDSKTSNNLYAVRFADAQHGWAVGFGGTILATSDGGLTWSTQVSGTLYALYAVTCTDASHAWIVGAWGTALTTTDGGQTWTAATSNTSEWLTGVAIPDGQHGWASTSGGHILATSDAGAHWAQQVTWTGHQFTSVSASDATHCWATDTAGDISYTADGGAHWYGNLWSTPSLLAVHFASAQRGLAVGQAGEVLYTGDGLHWNPANHAPTTVFTFEAVSFADASHGMALGDHGAVLKTADGGKTWQAGNAAGGWMEDLWFPDPTHAWCVGDAGVIMSTADGGTTWSAQTSNTTARLMAVFFLDAAHGWAVGLSGTIVATADGGTTWTAQDSTTSQDLQGIAFADATHGVAVGRSGTVMTTSNGGSTWVARVSHTTEDLDGASYPDASHAWAVGRSGAIVATTDGGLTWNPQNAGGDNFAVSFCTAQDGWLASGSGVYATTDGGLTWIPQRIHSQYEMFDIAAVGATHCWAVGGGGAILAYDGTPPVTTCSGADSLWHRSPVPLAFHASDEPGGSGMAGGHAETDFMIGQGSWTAGISLAVAAPADHSNDGLRVVSYRSIDAAGNIEATKTVTVKIDTTKPATAGKAAAGRKNRAVVLYYRVQDALSPQAQAVRVLVKTTHGKLLKTYTLGTRTTGKWYTVRWTPKAIGSYRYYVYGKDLAGNAQSRLLANRITVR